MNPKLILSVALSTCLFWISTLAQADVVVIVGAKSHVSALTKAQVSDLYLGRAKDFPTGGIALTTVMGSGAAKDEFFEKVLGKTDAQVRTVWARLSFTGGGTTPKELNTSAEVKKLATGNPNVIGFIEKSAVDSHVKVVYTP